MDNHKVLTIVTELVGRLFQTEMSRLGYAAKLRPTRIIEGGTVRRMMDTEANADTLAEFQNDCDIQDNNVTYHTPVGSDFHMTLEGTISSPRDAPTQGRAMAILENRMKDSSLNPGARHSAKLLDEYEYVVKECAYRFAEVLGIPGVHKYPARPPELTSDASRMLLRCAHQTANQLDKEKQTVQSQRNEVMALKRKIEQYESLDEHTQLLERVKAKTKQKYLDSEDILLEFAKFTFGTVYPPGVPTAEAAVSNFLDDQDG